MNARKFVDVGDFGFRDLAREHAANTLAARMHVQHHLSSALAIQAEEGLKHGDNEVHRGEVIIEQDHLVKRRAHDFRARFLDGQSVCMFDVLFG